LPTKSGKVYDFCANKTRNEGYFLPVGTIVEVKQATATAALDDQNFVKDVVKKPHDGIDYLTAELKKLCLNSKRLQSAS